MSFDEMIRQEIENHPQWSAYDIAKEWIERVDRSDLVPLLTKAVGEMQERMEREKNMVIRRALDRPFTKMTPVDVSSIKTALRSEHRVTDRFSTGTITRWRFAGVDEIAARIKENQTAIRESRKTIRVRSAENEELEDLLQLLDERQAACLDEVMASEQVALA